MGGTRLAIYGQVLTKDCKPLANAVLEFWQADAQGNYDNAGYRLRGHQSTDSNGQYRLETVVPGLYPGRTRHIHVKVVPPSGPALTTQLFLPQEAQNKTDSTFDQALLLPIQDTADGKAASFNFILNVN